MKTDSNFFSVTIQAAPPSGVSPPGTIIPGAAVQIIDSTGASWTVISPVGGITGQVGIARNGIRVASSVDYGTIDTSGVFWLYDIKSGNGWEKWIGSSWVSSSTPPVVS